MDDHISDSPTVPGTSTMPRAPELERIQQLLPPLEISELLGQGGMGAVFAARQPALDRAVAVKVLYPQHSGDPNFAERFRREAQAMARLHHPGIVMVHDSGVVDDLYYLVMEYVDGVSLRQVMGTGLMEPKVALGLVPQICDALEYAHSQGIAHRDIKPENILVTQDGRVKIADFGLAKLVARRQTDYALTAPQQVMGTMHYMAPEQIERPSEVDHRADIYALGVVLYEMLTGELPIGRFPLPSEEVQTDPRLDQIVLHALEKDPGRRYQHASDVRLDIEQVSSSLRTGPAYAAQVARQTYKHGTALTPPPYGGSSHAMTPPAGQGFAAGYPTPAPHVSPAALPNPRKPEWAYLLWCTCFVAVCGMHRFYAGKYITGVIWLFTGGVFFLGQLIDLFLIPRMIEYANWKTMRDAERRRAMVQASRSIIRRADSSVPASGPTAR